MGISLGRQLTRQEMISLLLAFLLTTMVLLVGRRVQGIWHRHETGLFELVAALLRKIRDYCLAE